MTMSILLNSISSIGTFIVLFFMLYFIRKVTIGFLPIFKKNINNRLSLTRGQFIFSISSIIIILTTFNFYLPYS